MSSRKLKQNDENLCPITSKRSKSTESPLKSNKTISNSAWIAAKLQESTSSPSGLSNEYLEEMGVGLLDSEESSSSAASTINFAVALSSVSSNNADENCNEATPNLDATKFLHKHCITTARLSLDQTVNSLDATNSSIKQNDTPNGSGSNNNVNNNNNDCSTNSFAIFNDEEPELKSKLQHKTLAILADSPNGSVLGSGHKRSPLATVVCNNQNLNTQQQQQQQLQQVSPNSLNVETGLSHSTTNTPDNIATVPIQAHIIETQISRQQDISLSPQHPMTSHQAALQLKQQQEEQQQQQQYQQHLYQLQQIAAFNRQNLPQKLQSQNNASTKEEFFIFRNKQLYERQMDARKSIDHFNLISDEIVLQIFKWLPKKTLLRCGSVCRRFYHCAADESLWTRLDLGSRSLRPEVMPNVLMRGVAILRLAQTNFREPVFPIPSPHLTPEFQSKLQYLDLSLAQIDKLALKTLLSHCRQLKKLSLEHVPLNNDICNEIAENTNLEALNLAMCTGLEAWSVRKMFKPLKNLNSLNISWTNLSVDAVTSLVTHVTSNLIRLNVAGCRKTMFDTHVASLAKRCPQLIELDLSDCTGLTGGAITILGNFKMLEYLSLSRCYLIPVMSYLDLHKLPTLAFLDVFGTLSDDAVKMVERSLTGIGINKFVHSSVARPTVGTRRTSIWGLRTRD